MLHAVMSQRELRRTAQAWQQAPPVASAGTGGMASVSETFSVRYYDRWMGVTPARLTGLGGAKKPPRAPIIKGRPRGAAQGHWRVGHERRHLSEQAFDAYHVFLYGVPLGSPSFRKTEIRNLPVGRSQILNPKS